MAELEVGKHCSYEACKQLDFLPFECDGCGKVFCREHQVKDKHSCDCQLLQKTEKEATPYLTYDCSLENCQRTEKVPVPCDYCKQNFCMAHRHAVDHSCKDKPIRTISMEKTKQHVQSIVEKSAAAAASKPKMKSTRNLEMAAKVGLMKLKQNAKGDSGVPTESRVYLSVNLPAVEPGKQSTAAVWLDQSWTVGKCVDYMSDRSNIKNENNIPDKPKLVLSTLNTGLIYNTEETLNSLLDRKALYNGGTVDLRYVAEFQITQSNLV